MRQLTVRQPFADLIARGEKTIETRSWRTKYRGPLLICASKKKCGSLPTGVIVALVNLVEVRPFFPSDALAACCEWRPNAFAWEIRNVRNFSTPIACRGSLGLGTPAPELINRIQELLQ